MKFSWKLIDSSYTIKSIFRYQINLNWFEDLHFIFRIHDIFQLTVVSSGILEKKAVIFKSRLKNFHYGRNFTCRNDKIDIQKS